jgi:hypothetical protein
MGTHGLGRKRLDVDAQAGLPDEREHQRRVVRQEVDLKGGRARKQNVRPVRASDAQHTLVSVYRASHVHICVVALDALSVVALDALSVVALPHERIRACATALRDGDG